MFSRIYIVISFLLVFLVFVGCTKQIDIDVGDFDKRLVINSLITTDEPIKVILARSESVGENIQDRYIQNAVIELYKGDDFVEHLQETVLEDSVYNYYTNENEVSTIKRSIYTSSVLAEEGASYTLKTGYEGYNDVSAETSVPKYIEIKEIDFSSLKPVTNNNGGNTYLSGSVYIDIDDPADEINYYGIDWFTEYTDDAYAESVYNETTGEYELDTVERTYLNHVYFQVVRGESAVAEELDLELEPDLPIFSEEDAEIDVHNLRLYADHIYLGNNNDNLTNVKHIFYLKSISEDFYRYELTRIRQDYLQDNFLAEPVFVYSNVENGLGIFAGVNESTYTSE